MEGRHEERERLRAERQTAESGDAAALARKRRIQYLTLAAFAAVAVIVALIVISQSGGGGSPSEPPSNVVGVAEVNSELRGLTQNGQLLGDSSAPVTVIEYGDPQCSSCKFFSQRVAPSLISSEVRTGKLNCEFRPLIVNGPSSTVAMRAPLG